MYFCGILGMTSHLLEAGGGGDTIFKAAISFHYPESIYYHLLMHYYLPTHIDKVNRLPWYQ